MKRIYIYIPIAIFVFALSCFCDERGEFLRREGEGYLEKVDGLLVLHVSGTPYEMGFQHGKLLKKEAIGLLDTLINQQGGKIIEVPELGIKQSVKDVLKILFKLQRPFYKKRFIEEMKGLAAGAGVDEELVFLVNHLPELFHCSGFALMDEATKNGELYHGRVLDYATDWGLQNHAVVIVAKPKGRNAFANVSFAGFIGSVTGLNNKNISIGEMGGGGQLFWSGEPMSFLIRRVLEETDNLKEAVEIFRTGPRTCQYFYVISDGEAGKAVGLSTTWQDFEVILPGQFHRLLPLPVKDCLLLSAKDRYKKLVGRTTRDLGEFDAEKAIRLMDAPVSMKSNLHNALMIPRTGDLHVAYAAKGGSAAWCQKYVHLNLFKLLDQTQTLSRIKNKETNN